MHQIVQPVDMIAMYSSSGKILPIRFRIKNEEKEQLCVNIEEVIKTTEVAYVGAEATVFCAEPD